MQANARNGNIESKLDLPVTSAGESQSISGQVGKGGPRIALVSDHGDIEITAMDVVPEPPAPPAAPGAPAPPAPPAPPGPGAKSLRHLRPPKDAKQQRAANRAVRQGSWFWPEYRKVGTLALPQPFADDGFDLGHYLIERKISGIDNHRVGGWL